MSNVVAGIVSLGALVFQISFSFVFKPTLLFVEGNGLFGNGIVNINCLKNVADHSFLFCWILLCGVWYSFRSCRGHLPSCRKYTINIMNPIFRLLLVCFMLFGVYSTSSLTNIQPSGKPNLDFGAIISRNTMKIILVYSNDNPDEGDTVSSKECSSSSNSICNIQQQQSYSSNELEMLTTDASEPPEAIVSVFCFKLEHFLLPMYIALVVLH